jgi:hypothetical protein
LKVDLKGYQGKVWKSAVVTSNDPQKPTLHLNLQGKVKPWIEIRPSAFIRFKIPAEGPEERTVELSSPDQPFEILKIESSLGERIKVRVETLIEKKKYRLKVINHQKEGGFFGTIKCITDHPRKPEVLIQVSGR